MIDTREYISNLGMPEKVTLFKELYNELAGYGIDGDTELAHVNTFEASLLKSLGGSGTINDVTGLTEYKGGGGQQQAPPAQSTVTQTSEFPTELKPFIKDVLGEGQAEFVREKEEGFQAFPGPQLAQFTPEQQAAFTAGREQFTGLAGTPLGQASTYYQPALAATALGTAEIGTEDIQRRMDPFLQNVVDIAKREARRDEDVAAQQRAAQAVGAGSFGGSRQAIVESEAERNLGERLADIQARGLSASFQQAQQAAEQQRAREMTGGRQFAALGDTTGARARSDIAGLAGIGETQQQRSQQALDIAQREFEQERAFPQAALQRYASLIRGFPLQATQQRFATQTVPTPSFAQTLLGGAGQAAGLYGMMGGFRNKGGLVSLQGGGSPMQQIFPQGSVNMSDLRSSGFPLKYLAATDKDFYNKLKGMGAQFSGQGIQQGAAQPGARHNIGNVGGYGTTPTPTPEQTPPIPDATRDQQITALNAMQQRGAALRNLAKPQSNISPMNIRNAIVGSGVLPGSRRMASEGGLMSIVRRADAGRLESGITDPKIYAEGAFGPGGYSGLQATIQERSDPSDWGWDLRPTEMGAEEREAALSMKKKNIDDKINEVQKEQEQTTDPTKINQLTKLMNTLEKMRQEVGTAYDKSSEIMGDIDKKWLEAIGGAPDYYKQRQEDLSERRKREQFGNIAQFFARLGTSTAPAAQVGGFRGLLGAAVAAGEQTIPEAIATEAEYAEQEDVLSDKLFDSNIKYLSASRDIAKEDFDRGTEKARLNYEMALKAGELGVDIQVAENERIEALNDLGPADSAEIRKVLDAYFNVAMTDDGIWMMGDQPMTQTQRLQMNDVETTAALILRANGGDFFGMRELIQPEVEAVLGGNYIFRKHRTGNIEEVEEVEETDIGGDVSEKERVTITTGSPESLVDKVYGD